MSKGKAANQAGKPTFNLWSEPWIHLEMPDGVIQRCGIGETLTDAHRFVAIYDPSPLVVASIQRLLTAVLQDALDPKETADLDDLWRAGRFPSEAIAQFGKKHAGRFDLFSEDAPFLQSADLPLIPGEKTMRQGKPAMQLFPEVPTGPSFVSLYRHVSGDVEPLAPATVAKGLVCIPAFATAGGARNMASINGVPPIYVLPAGATLFESLTAGLMTRTFLQQTHTVGKEDLPWWRRTTPTVVIQSRKRSPKVSLAQSKQMSTAGYLHGLTFPARKMRLYPEPATSPCARTGEVSEWQVRRMDFMMGESLLDDAPLWRDPFVAYRLPVASKSSKQKRGEKPKPVRPRLGWASWREFSGLFLTRHDVQARTHLRPLFLEQLAQLEANDRVSTWAFRCVGWQTNGKMKYFEWTDVGFDVPLALLQDPDGADWTDEALAFAGQCAGVIAREYGAAFGKESKNFKKPKNSERYKRLKIRMEADYWAALAQPFRAYVRTLGTTSDRQLALADWRTLAARQAQAAFDSAAEATGDEGRTLRAREEGKAACRQALADVLSNARSGKENRDQTGTGLAGKPAARATRTTVRW